MFKYILNTIKISIFEFFNPETKFARLSRNERKTSTALFTEQYQFNIKKSLIYLGCSKCGRRMIEYSRKNNSIAFTKCLFCGRQI